MPKYRLLSAKELPGFEKEFIDFLILNGITGPDWQKMQQEDATKAAEIIDLFSDVIWEGILRKVEYLEHHSQLAVRCFQCLPEQIVLVAIEASSESKVDFTDREFLQRSLEDPPRGIKIYTSSKNYKDNREMELFKMIESGCEVSEGKLFKALAMGL